MKTRYALALAMLTGTGIGAVAVENLRAQPKPTIYLITEIDVTDPDNYGKEFAPRAQATIRKSGGRFVVIGGVAGVGAKPVEAFEGTPPKGMTIQAWESMEALKSWYEREEYQSALKVGRQYANFRRYAVEGQ